MKEGDNKRERQRKRERESQEEGERERKNNAKGEPTVRDGCKGWWPFAGKRAWSNKTKNGIEKKKKKGRFSSIVAAFNFSWRLFLLFPGDWSAAFRTPPFILFH